MRQRPSAPSGGFRNPLPRGSPARGAGEEGERSAARKDGCGARRLAERAGALDGGGGRAMSAMRRRRLGLVGLLWVSIVVGCGGGGGGGDERPGAPNRE